MIAEICEAITSRLSPTALFAVNKGRRQDLTAAAKLPPAEQKSNWKKIYHLIEHSLDGMVAWFSSLGAYRRYYAS